MQTLPSGAELDSGSHAASLENDEAFSGAQFQGISSAPRLKSPATQPYSPGKQRNAHPRVPIVSAASLASHALHLSPLRSTGRILARQIVPKRRFATTAKRAPPGRRRRLATPRRSGSTWRAPSCPCPSWLQFVLAAHWHFSWLKMLSWDD